MRDFEERLEARLVQLARDAETPVPSQGGRRSRLGAVLGLTGVGGLAGAGAVVALTGTGMADLPIFSTPARDASSALGPGTRAALAGTDVASAHVFQAQQGPGYVTRSKDGRIVCLSVPREGRYPGSCRPAADAERDGITFEVVGDLGRDPKATSDVAFVLPENAEQVRIADGDAARPARLESGVWTASLTRPARLTWTVDGRRASRTFEGPFPATSYTVLDCGNGRSVKVRSGDEIVRREPGRRDLDLAAMRQRFCR